MAKLFQRNYRLVLGTHDVSGLHISFRLEKSLAKQANTAQVKVYGLGEELRQTLEKSKNLYTQLDVGYGEELSTIFLGKIRTAISETNGPEIITTIEGADGETEMQGARIGITVSPNTPADKVLDAIAKGFGLGIGNVSSFANRLSGIALYPTGKVITGSASQAMQEFTKATGLGWSIQDGKLQITDKKSPLPGLAFELSSDSGLIGSPSVDSKGVATATSLFIAGIKPGAQIVFKSRSVNGGYRAQKCTYVGDFAGNEWFVNIEATKY